jgi:hypothetical protein
MKYVRLVVLALAIETSMLLAAAEAASENPAIPAPAAPINSEQQQTISKDPIEPLNDAIGAYKKGNYNDALSKIDAAKKSVGMKRVEAYQSLLPPIPRGGWSLSDDTPDRFMFSFVQRTYKANGNTVTIKYTFGEDMLNIMKAGANVVVDTMMSANKAAFDVKGNKADYRDIKLGDKIISHEVEVHAGKVLVTVVSETIGKDVLVQFADLVDFDKLRNLQ